MMPCPSDGDLHQRADWLQVQGRKASSLSAPRSRGAQQGLPVFFGWKPGTRFSPDVEARLVVESSVREGARQRHSFLDQTSASKAPTPTGPSELKGTGRLPPTVIDVLTSQPLATEKASREFRMEAGVANSSDCLSHVVEARRFPIKVPGEVSETPRF